MRTGEAASRAGSDQNESTDRWRTLHRHTLVVTAVILTGVAIAAGVPTAIGIASGTSTQVALAWVLPCVVALIGGGVAVDYLRWRRVRYRVSATAMELHRGVVVMAHRSLARERIRSVDVGANPVQRILGLVTVTIGTGDGRQGHSGSGEQTLVLNPVTRDEGERLRTLLLDRGGPAPAAAPGDRPLASWDPAWLGFAPLSFLTPLLAASAVGAIFQVSEWFGQQQMPIELARDVIEAIGPWAALLALVAGFVLVGAVGSMALFVEAWWSYRLDREPGGTVRVRRGLLTTRSVSLEERRIRGVEVVEPLGARSAGAARLDVIATGISSDRSKELSVLVPAAPRGLVWTVAGEIAGSPVAVGLLAHPVRARTRRLWRAAAAAAATGVAAGAVVIGFAGSLPQFWSWVIVGLAVVIGAVAVGLAWDGYRSLGHGADARHLVVRRGSLRRSTVALQRTGIIGWRIRQSLFQRRAGLMTLTATTAAGAGRYSIVDADQHEGLEFAAGVVPGLLEPLLIRGGNAGRSLPAEPARGRGEGGDGPSDQNGP